MAKCFHSSLCQHVCRWTSQAWDCPISNCSSTADRSPINIVTQEQVVGVWCLACDLENLQQVMELPMCVTNDHHRRFHMRHIGLLRQQLLQQSMTWQDQSKQQTTACALCMHTLVTKHMLAAQQDDRAWQQRCILLHCIPPVLDLLLTRSMHIVAAHHACVAMHCATLTLHFAASSTTSCSARNLHSFRCPTWWSKMAASCCASVLPRDIWADSKHRGISRASHLVHACCTCSCHKAGSVRLTGYSMCKCHRYGTLVYHVMLTDAAMGNQLQGSCIPQWTSHCISSCPCAKNTSCTPHTSH